MFVLVGFNIAQTDEFETTGSWRLVRRTLGVDSFGINVVEITPGSEIPTHDEIDRDQEEVFVFLDGNAVLIVDGEEHEVTAGTFARIDPEHKRTVRNDGGESVNVLIVSAPRTSGYEPMSWA
jgi:mannose-6-phosphate isomerase-like protein (cupin superfamily)